MLRLFLLISNLPECLFSRCGVPLYQFHPRFCSPMTALSAEVTSSEVSRTFPKPKLRLSTAPYSSLLMDSSCPLLISMTVVFYTLMALVKDCPYPPAGWGFPPACGPATIICHFDCHPCVASRISFSSDGLLRWG